MFSRIANRLVLKPSTHEIETLDQSAIKFDSSVGQLEAYQRHVAIDQFGKPIEQEATNDTDGELEIVLKFPGAGGRAENSTPHPMNLIPNSRSVIWTTNSPGFGKSQGPPAISKIPAMAEAALKGISEQYGENKRVLIVANSLGNLPAMYLAARFPNRVKGMLLRNPPPLREVILAQRAAWTTAFLSYPIAASVPRDLCLIKNANECRCPALFVTSERDGLVPPDCQRRVFEAYSGTHRKFVIPDGDHDSPIPEESAREYIEHVQWWYTQSQQHADES